VSETFKYRVRDKSGNLLEGELDAESVSIVAARLRQQGLIPLGIDRKATGGLQGEVRIPGLTDRIKLKDMAIFSRQFATMINSGLSLLRSLSILSDQTDNRALARIIGEVRSDVETGSSLSVAMGKHPRAFSNLYVSMVKAGETGGVLDGALMRLAETIEKQVSLRNKVKSAMTYPIMAMALIGMISTGMLVFIVPQFDDLYSSLGGELPLPTKALLILSNFFVKYGLLAGIPASIAGSIAFRYWVKTPQGRAMWDAMKLRAPIFGGIVQKSSLARFARTFSVLLRSGVPILEALDIVTDTVGNTVVARAVEDVKAAVKRGDSLARPLAEHSVFPPMVVQMMAVGEETGALDTMLEKIAEFYEEEVETLVEALASLIEPLLIVIMGIVVGSMLIALYMPMFNIINLIE